MLNNGKTGCIVTGTRQQLAKVKIDHIIRVSDCEIKPTTSVHGEGTCFDVQFTMATNITKICSVAFCHLHNDRRVRKYLSQHARGSTDFDLLINYKQGRLLQ